VNKFGIGKDNVDKMLKLIIEDGSQDNNRLYEITCEIQKMKEYTKQP